MKILLVDDSKSARYALRLQLQRYGMKVETADAAETALEQVRDAPPDAIFMDHTMPGMNGFEALEILKSAPSTMHIPVVMCTSNEDPEFLAQAKRKGALDILSKSTASEKLVNLLGRLQRAVASPAAHAAVAESASPYRTATQVQPPRADVLTEERLEERVRTLVEPIMDELSERLAVDLVAKIDEKLISHLAEEAERLQRTFIKAQSEQAQLTTNRLVNDLLPQLVRQHIEQEKQYIARLVQDLIDASVDGLVDEPTFISRVLGTFEANAISSAEHIAKRQSQETAETVASKRVGEVVDRLIRSSAPSLGIMYILATGAAVVGIVSATVVFFLLS
jgi:CheY-like chemotaxis protein